MKTINSTSYHDETPESVIKWLETSRERKQRIRIFYGDSSRCWNDEFNTIGYIGRSTGTEKIPLLIKNSRSYGGGAILDHCIIRIDTKGSNDKIKTVYLKEGIKFDTFVSTDIGTVYNETKDELYARCKNGNSGKRLADFMNGKRWSK
jgi:hypothetical protein